MYQIYQLSHLDYLALKKLLEAGKEWAFAELKARNIIIRQDGDFYLFKYNQLDADFSDPIVRACRGSIAYYNEYTDKFRLVCLPFTRFAYGESDWEPKINWKKAVALEKVDGSLFKAYYYRGWHLSTNGIIDAFKAPVGDTDRTFGDLFEEAIGKPFELWAEFYLDDIYTYMFELVGPENHLVIQYDEPRVYFLAKRNIYSWDEEEIGNELDDAGVYRVKTYAFNSSKELYEMVMDMKDLEGVVVCDDCFNRVKIKSEDYLIKHYMDNNGMITVKRILKMIREDTLDDYMAFIGDKTGLIQKVLDAIVKLKEDMEYEYSLVCNLKIENRGELVEHMRIMGFRYTGFVFAMLDEKVQGADEYIGKLMMPTFKKFVERYIER